MPVDFQSSLASLLRSFAMVASAVQVAKRALVSLLVALAQLSQIQLRREDDAAYRTGSTDGSRDGVRLFVFEGIPF